jgi:hypothetical protein
MHIEIIFKRIFSQAEIAKVHIYSVHTTIIDDLIISINSFHSLMLKALINIIYSSIFSVSSLFKIILRKRNSYTILIKYIIDYLI